MKGRRVLHKPLEYYAVILGMILYVAARHAESEALWRRLAKTGASAALALGGSSDAAGWAGVPESLAVVAIMAFGLFLLDVGTALVQDRDFIRAMIQKKMGGGNE